MPPFRPAPLALLALLTTAIPVHATIDRDHDGISDVWAALYPTAGAPSADPDGDGADNLAESRAGTNPLDPRSCLRGFITAELDGSLRLRWPSVLHKQYQIQSSADLATWTNLGGARSGSGTEQAVLIRAAGAATETHRFWRVAVTDTGTNADGITDWENAVSVSRIAAQIEAYGIADYAVADSYSIAQWLASQNADGSWPTIDYDSQARNDWPPYAHLRRLACLASDFADPTSPDFHGAALSTAFARGLQFWVNKRPISANIWHNDIGVPLVLGPALVIMRHQLDPALLAAASELIPLYPRDANWATGENLVWNSSGTICRAILADDSALLSRSVAQIGSVLAITTGEGIQVDGTFHQHTTQIYNGGYGLALIKDVARWARALAGTAYALTPDQRNSLDHLMLDGDAWMIRRATFDYSTQGRNYARAIGEKPADLTRRVRDTIDLILAAGSSRAGELQALRDHIGGAGPGVVGFKHFWRGDYAVQRTAAAMVSLRLVSKRSVGAECGGDENLRGVFQGCGETMIYRDGLEYHEIFPVWNWLRLPGTTLEQTATVPPISGYVRGTAPFVGGVSDGTVGLSAFIQADLKAARTSTTPTEVRPMPAARKSWFFFGDGFLALGAGITCATANPVFTTVNQTLLRGEVRVSAGGTVSTRPAGNTAIPNTAWVHHDGVGYVFPSPTAVRLANTAQSGSWSLITAYASAATVTKEVFTLGLDHGVAPTDATYAYVVLPGADEAATSAFAALHPITLLANTPQTQAARIASLHLNAIAFFEPGSVTLKPGLTVSSDQPALLLLRTETDGHTLTVADPTQLLTALTLTLSGRYSTAGATYDTASNTTRIPVALPNGQDAGSSVRIQLSN